MSCIDMKKSFSLFFLFYSSTKNRIKLIIKDCPLNHLVLAERNVAAMPVIDDAGVVVGTLRKSLND